MSSKEERTTYMLRCRLCGRKSPEGTKRCLNPGCNADLDLYSDVVIDDTIPVEREFRGVSWEEEVPEPELVQPEETETSEPKKKVKSAIGWLIGLAAVMVAAVLAVLVLPLLGSSGGDAQLRETEVTVPTDTEPTVTEQIQTDPAATEYLRSWEDNVMISDEVNRVAGINAQIPKVFGQNIERDKICTITFLDSAESAPTSAWDLSAKQDGSVLAWVVSSGEFFDLYIAGDGGVCAPENCSKLFYYYRNVTEINFNNCFHTDHTTSMNSMFSYCDKLTKLDLSGFVTSSVTDMSEMFDWTLMLKDLDISSFNTSNVTDMSEMFSNTWLISLDLRHFDTAEVTDMSLCLVVPYF